MIVAQNLYASAGLAHPERGLAGWVGSHLLRGDMDAFERVARDMREFAIEVKRPGYSLLGGYENRCVELSERMIKRTDDLARSRH